MPFWTTSKALNVTNLNTAPPYQGDMVTGLWYGAPQGSNGTSAGQGTGVLRVHPFIVGASTSFDRIACEVTGVGEAGSLVRLGIYSDNGSYYPGTLLLDAGTVAGDVLSVTTERIITISQTLSGVVWLAAAVQTVVTTQPTLRVLNNASPHVILGQGTTVQSGATTGYLQSPVTGAFPGTFTSTVTSAASVPRILLRKA